MNELKLIKDLTGEYPVYPGHPLVVAVQIMHAFPSITEANAPTSHGWSEALGDNRISGAGCHVSKGLHLLVKGTKGATIDEIVAEGIQYWEDGRAGGHVKNVDGGSVQARLIEPYFRAAAQSWLAGKGLPGIL